MNNLENDNDFKNDCEPTFLNEDRETLNTLSTSVLQDGDSSQPKKRKKGFKRTVTIGLCGAILTGASFGFCFGVGLNSSKNLFRDVTLPFSFDNIAKTETETVEAQTTALDLNPSEGSITSVINSVENSVVNISIKATAAGYFNQLYETEGSGSGVIYSEDNDKVYIVTNNHVIDSASAVTISITGDEQVNAVLVGKDASSDLAVISVLKSDLNAAGVDNIKVATFGDSDALEVGEYVIAIGNALGEGKTATRGIISAVNKNITIEGTDLSVIQTDAAINPGNSGGALVNTSGEVIGINTAKTAQTAVEGTGYAIPISLAQDTIKELMETGSVDKPYLGMSGYTINEDFKQIYNVNIDGVFIAGIESNSPAEQAGLQVTDIITKIDNVTITDSAQLADYINSKKSGDKVSLTIIRNGSTQMTLIATLVNYNEKF